MVQPIVTTRMAIRILPGPGSIATLKCSSEELLAHMIQQLFQNFDSQWFPEKKTLVVKIT